MSLVLFVGLLVVAPGCGGAKKAALTDEEIRQKTYAQRPTLPDEMVIAGETITCEDVMILSPAEDASSPTVKERLESRAREVDLDTFLTEARPLILQRLRRNVISQIVLAKRAKREVGGKLDESALDSMADKELRRFILEQHGGNGAEADADLQRRGMNRTTYKERLKRDLLAEYVVRSKLQNSRPITYAEILAKYDEIKDTEYLQEGSLQLRVIDVAVAKMKVDDVTKDPVAKALQVAGDLRKRIDGGEDFAEVATQYLNDPRGGLLRARAPDAYAAPYDVLAAKARDMKTGEVAGPIETPEHVFLIRVEAKQDGGYKPLGEVQEELRQRIQQDRRDGARKELETEIAQQAAATDTTQFVDACLEKLYRQARASMGDEGAAKTQP